MPINAVAVLRAPRATVVFFVLSRRWTVSSDALRPGAITRPSFLHGPSCTLHVLHEMLFQKRQPDHEPASRTSSTIWPSPQCSTTIASTVGQRDGIAPRIGSILRRT